MLTAVVNLDTHILEQSFREIRSLLTGQAFHLSAHTGLQSRGTGPGPSGWGVLDHASRWERKKKRVEGGCVCQTEA